MDGLTWRTGFEVELLAPAGSDRLVLAERIAADHGGRVDRSFHTDSEPSPVPGVDLFRHLSPAFDVRDASGAPVARLVDDVTIRADLDGTGARGHRGWYRVLSDDARLLRLVERHVDPAAPLASVLDPVAALFGVTADVRTGSARVNDTSGATVAVVLPLPPGRERPCEVVTPPLVTGHRAALAALLGPARELGFTVPHEAAVHVHVDAGPFRTPTAFANVVDLFTHWREPLRAALGTNPACRRLGPLPPEAAALAARVRGDDPPTWEALAAEARRAGLTKFADVNLTQLVAQRPVRDTVEVRVLPGSIDEDAIVRAAGLVEALLRRCLDDRPLPRPDRGVASGAESALLDLAGAPHR
ncbi:amidoligase family protein [Cellulomonas fimi]|uniref:Amidoligase enzyme n=1 Tax=Cellulomonas fimi (strain ATCC 484 / DSM 20113 / JCM 1341 / CCUG 24087 / LMG 16345 / NBRC 15513 / NCIMB 8980 / NCTC 7547 / NRS-133) TaxID=590998 RepID=F4H2T7_CELFA|nr:amidoligase family protein [Cellulomonas fimi]AEE46436.1 hypothetical protein Celf_2309 [Cellulomonas fimi ATCC 484]NNH07728.1 hypothetical protein [Cellulomonas fimi]VEH32991.1 Putative amidoligase enzyme [Cellulomonas fimi]